MFRVTLKSHNRQSVTEALLAVVAAVARQRGTQHGYPLRKDPLEVPLPTSGNDAVQTGE